LQQQSPCIGTGRYGDDRGALPYGTTAIDDLATTPDNIQLLTNYPNPFNASTTINFQLPKSSHVTIEVFDIMGRSIAVLLNSEQAAGNHHLTWNASELPSGMYFYKLITDDFNMVGRMMLLK
jgi:hypothetical protein